MTDRYVIGEDGFPRPEPDIQKWGAWIEDRANKIVQQDRFPDDVLVSTVFLGMDHRSGLDDGPPILWETMILGGEHDGYQERYTSREDAVDGHAVALAIQRGERDA